MQTPSFRRPYRLAADDRPRDSDTVVQYGNPDPPGEAFDVVHRYGRREFESPYRSTVPLLSIILHDRPTLDDMLKQVGIRGPRCTWSTPFLHGKAAGKPRTQT